MTKTIKFTPELTELIKKGEKTTTFRLFDDKDLSEGDEVILATRDRENVTNFAQAKLSNVYTKLLKEMNENDFAGNETSSRNQVEAFREIYGDKVTEDTEVKIIRFEINKFF